MTSSFVSKAALIAKRKLEQKPVSERRERKKTLVKEDRKPLPDKPNEDPDVEKKVSYKSDLTDCRVLFLRQQI